MKEKISTTSFSEYQADIDTIAPVIYADVRGNVEQSTDHLPIRKNLFTVDDFIPTTPDVESVDSDEATPEIATESRTKRILRGLGKAAILPALAVHKVNEFSAYASLEAMARLPLFKSREELITARQARIEKYTAHENDSRITRIGKYIGRNAIKASAWSMTGITAAVAASPLLRPVIDIPAIHASIEEIADVTVLVGGRGDKTGDGVQTMLTGTGLLTGKIEKIHYPAGVSPLLGDPATSDQSAAIAAPQIIDVINKNRGKTIDVVSYSNGTLATDLAEKTIRQQNGGQLQEGMRSIKLGAPAAPDTGVLQNPFIGGAARVFGVSANTPTNGSNTVYVSNTKDLYGNGVNPSLDKVIGSLAGKDHDYSQATVGNASATASRASNGAATVTLGVGERSPATPSKPGKSAMMTEIDKIAPAGKSSVVPQETIPLNQNTKKHTVTLPVNNVRPHASTPVSNADFLRQIHAQRNRAPRAA